MTYTTHDEWKKNFVASLREKRKTYAKMVEFCADSMILNNWIIRNSNLYFDIYCGSDYDEETEEYDEVYQYFIIDGDAAERFADYTNELVYYCEDVDVYLLGVKHWGTGWDYVPANWKSAEELGE